MRLSNLFRRSSAAGKPDQTPERGRDLAENADTDRGQRIDRGLDSEPEYLRGATWVDYRDIPEPAREPDEPGRERPDAEHPDAEHSDRERRPDPAQPEDPVWARARELRGEYFRAMDLENTPAAFVSDEYDYDDDVWCDDLYSTPGSVTLERELGELVRAHPTLFTGTVFEVFRQQEDEHGEDQDRPPERELSDGDEEIEDDRPF